MQCSWQSEASINRFTVFWISRLDGWWERPSNIQRAGKWVHQNGQRSTSISGDQSKREPFCPVCLLCGCITVMWLMTCPLGGLQPAGHSPRWTCATERWSGRPGSWRCGHGDGEPGERGWWGRPRSGLLLPASEQTSQSSVKDGLLQSKIHSLSVNFVPRKMAFLLHPPNSHVCHYLRRWSFPHQMWRDTCPWPRVLTTP